MAKAYTSHRQKAESILAKAEEAGLLRYISPGAVLEDVKQMPGGDCINDATVWYWVRKFRSKADAA